jgi:hypothetical protein
LRIVIRKLRLYIKSVKEIALVSTRLVQGGQEEKVQRFH